MEVEGPQPRPCSYCVEVSPDGRGSIAVRFRGCLLSHREKPAEDVARDEPRCNCNTRDVYADRCESAWEDVQKEGIKNYAKSNSA